MINDVSIKAFKNISGNKLSSLDIVSEKAKSFPLEQQEDSSEGAETAGPLT